MPDAGRGVLRRGGEELPAQPPRSHRPRRIPRPGGAPRGAPAGPATLGAGGVRQQPGRGGLRPGGLPRRFRRSPRHALADPAGLARPPALPGGRRYPAGLGQRRRPVPRRPAGNHVRSLRGAAPASLRQRLGAARRSAVALGAAGAPGPAQRPAGMRHGAHPASRLLPSRRRGAGCRRAALSRPTCHPRRTGRACAAHRRRPARSRGAPWRRGRGQPAARTAAGRGGIRRARRRRLLRAAGHRPAARTAAPDRRGRRGMPGDHRGGRSAGLAAAPGCPAPAARPGAGRPRAAGAAGECLCDLHLGLHRGAQGRRGQPRGGDQYHRRAARPAAGERIGSLAGGLRAGLRSVGLRPVRRPRRRCQPGPAGPGTGARCRCLGGGYPAACGEPVELGAGLAGDGPQPAGEPGRLSQSAGGAAVRRLGGPGPARPPAPTLCRRLPPACAGWRYRSGHLVEPAERRYGAAALAFDSLRPAIAGTGLPGGRHPRARRAGPGGRRAVDRRRQPGPRLSQRSRTQRPALRPRCPGPLVSHRRSRSLLGRRYPGIPRSGRPAGESARPAHRVGRGGGRAVRPGWRGERLRGGARRWRGEPRRGAGTAPGATGRRLHGTTGRTALRRPGRGLSLIHI
ncbi:hypothetical protein PAERUG_E16_London_17_VIM_2_04_14_06192 [Pseudomonas aeruginosa]|nr:hypothetical protein PAERUG_E16_London_17_VIM_2_04_14_06192 [Pseudomonas aeruginosa]